MTSDCETTCNAESQKDEQLSINDLSAEEDKGILSAAQKARAERNRQKARILREARLVQPQKNNVAEASKKDTAPALDSGGGFFLPEESTAPPRLAPQPAPFIYSSEQPYCLECKQQFPQSYLLDTFDYNVCDPCRDDEEAHALLTRTEAKSEYLLKDCDLDLRPPPLRCVRRRNPHRSRFAEMRLYLRAQVEARALLVWGSEAALEEERAARRGRSERAAQTAARRRLRALRMDVRSSLYERAAQAHAHAFGPERYDAARDLYERACACGHVESYEKM